MKIYLTKIYSVFAVIQYSSYSVKVVEDAVICIPVVE